MSGRPATSRAASPGAAISEAMISSAPAYPAGRTGATTSVSVRRSMGRPTTAPFLASRSVSLRPIMPAAPVMRMCIRISFSQRHPAVDEVRLAGHEARFVRSEEYSERRHLLGGAEPPQRLTVDEGLLHRLVRLAGGSGDLLHPLTQRRR